MLRSRIPGFGSLDAAAEPVDANRLDVAASQFIEDMEDKAEVPDR